MVAESVLDYLTNNPEGYWYGFVDRGPIFEYRAAPNRNKVIALPSRNVTGRLLETKQVDGKWFVRLENRPPAWALKQYNLVEAKTCPCCDKPVSKCSCPPTCKGCNCKK